MPEIEDVTAEDAEEMEEREERGEFNTKDTKDTEVHRGHKEITHPRGVNAAANPGLKALATFTVATVDVCMASGRERDAVAVFAGNANVRRSARVECGAHRGDRRRKRWTGWGWDGWEGQHVGIPRRRR